MGIRRGTLVPRAIMRGSVPVKRVMVGFNERWRASVYPVSGAWSVAEHWGTTRTQFASHTIVESGTYTVTHSVSAVSARTAWVTGPWGATGGSEAPGEQLATVSTVRTLIPGDVVTFEASQSTQVAYGMSGTWSITKN